jgi:hypothetical protein
MRSSYITEFYKNHKKLVDQNDLSFLMRHSAGTANKHYNKIDDNKPMSKTELEQENDQLKNDLDLCESGNQSCNEKKLSEKLYTKRRYDVVYNLNHKPGVTPRQSSLDKYQIYYDDETNLYV